MPWGLTGPHPEKLCPFLLCDKQAEYTLSSNLSSARVSSSAYSSLSKDRKRHPGISRSHSAPISGYFDTNGSIYDWINGQRTQTYIPNSALIVRTSLLR